MATAEVRVMEKIPRSGLICGKPLGHGGFGSVINGTYNGKDVAVKILHSPVRAESYIEFNFMFQLKHKNLARMLGIVDLGYNECPQLVFLKATRGNLLQYVEGIQDDVLEPLKKGMLNKLASDVINGMEYLHQMHYFHKTLAARNILITQFKDFLNAQISDYGISRVIDGQGGNYYKTEEGVTLPIRWTPKECIPSGNSIGGFQFASDVWSFGVVLWEAWTKGDVPYGAARSNTEVRQLIINGRSPLTFFRPQCPADVMAIMESIFRERPEERPSFTDLGKAFNRMKPQQQNNEKKTGGKNEGEGHVNNQRQQHEKGPKNPKNQNQQGGENIHKQKLDGNGNKDGNKQPGKQNWPNYRPPNPNQGHPNMYPNQGPQNMQNQNQRSRTPNMHNPNQRPPTPLMHNPNQRPPTPKMHNPNQRPPNPNTHNPNQRPPTPNMQNPNQNPPNMPNQGQPGPRKNRQNRGPQQQQGPQVPMDAPPPYSPPMHSQPPPMMSFAGAAPPAFVPPPPPPSYSSGGNSEADMQKRMMDLQQKISSLEVKQLEQKLESLQKEVQGAKNKPKHPNPQHKKNPNQNKNPNQQQRPQSNPNKPPEFVPYGATPQYPNFQGHQNANQGHSNPSNNVPDWMPAAGSAIFGMAAGAAIATAAAAALNKNEKKKKK